MKIYDVTNKRYVKNVLKRKERWSIGGCFANHGKSWVYMDALTHKEITEYVIYDKIIRARF